MSEEEVKYSKDDRKKVIDEWLNKIKSWEKAINAWVIGPGLGRDPYIHEFFPLLVKSIAKNKVVVFDPSTAEWRPELKSKEEIKF